MKYKGFLIEPRYLFDFKQKSATGEFYTTKKGVDYYEIFDPIDGGKRFSAENTLDECKKTIDDLLLKIGLKDNTPETWANLDKL